MHQNKKTNSHK